MGEGRSGLCAEQNPQVDGPSPGLSPLQRPRRPLGGSVSQESGRSGALAPGRPSELQKGPRKGGGTRENVCFWFLNSEKNDFSKTLSTSSLVMLGSHFHSWRPTGAMQVRCIPPALRPRPRLMCARLSRGVNGAWKHSFSGFKSPNRFVILPCRECLTRWPLRSYVLPNVPPPPQGHQVR